MIFEVVEHLDATGDTIVARIPGEGSGDFTTGSQLIVQDNQVAVFYRDGHMADQFRAGRYTLSTQNLPLIGSFAKLAFHGKSPFRAYVYFVNLKVFTDLGWGTPQPILFRDTEFKMVNLRANGTFALKIADHVRFLNTIVGTQGLQSTPAVHEYIRKVIAARFAATLPKVLTTVLDLAAQYQNVEVSLKSATRDDLAQYGIELVDLLVLSITLPQEVQQIIDRGTGMRTLQADEVGKYQQVAAADALRTAAASGGGGEMAAGLGVGAGLAMAQQFVAGAKATPASSEAAATPGRLTMDQVRAKLRDLKALKDEGLISEADYEAQKKRLLEQV